MAEQPLSDIRVLDFTHYLAGPYCTKLLADFGADVIKIEQPDAGDPARRLGPFPGDVPHPEKSGAFLHLNTNKRSVTLNLKTPEARAIVLELAKGADILVESFRPGVMTGFGLDYGAVAAVNPDIIYTSLSNFGQTGPYRDYQASELSLFAMGGKMNRSGLPDRFPIKLGGNHVQYQAGNVGAMSTLFAWFGRTYRGIGGQYLDVAVYETQAASYNSRMPYLLAYQYNQERATRGESAGSGYPVGYYPCADGYISIQGSGAFFPRVAKMLGHPEWAAPTSYGPPAGQMDAAKKDEFEYEIWIPWLLERTKLDVVALAQDNDVLCGAVNTMDEVVNSPQFAARGWVIEAEHPAAGALRYPGGPARTAEGWWQFRRPAPLLGQHTAEVLGGELGRSPAELARLRELGVI